MATYFHGTSEIQGGGGGDGLQTLLLMNPGYVQYSDTPPPQHNGNLVFLNSATAAGGGNNSLVSHAPSHGQQFIGIPISATAEQSMHGHYDISTAATMHGFAQRGNYNLWNTIDPNTAARESTRATQGLSLSLPAMSGDDVRVSGGSPSSASGVTNVGNCGVLGIQSVLLSSKYLKATQELLEEVVNVNNNNSVSNKGEQQVKKSFEKNKVVGESSSCGGGGGEESGGKRGSELSTTERQEIQMKKAKLIAMLDEVEQRYRQYHRQMQIVISSFEEAAGIGSATTYTSLALETISKQFRCLKDCITEQIRGANKSLGSEDNDDYSKKMMEGSGSRLKYVDHHLRQQRAIQQLGMIHHHHNHNAWRPQRGLPERSVSVLRAWLFEHFLHPYPKDSDKHMLAKQTGLTRSQVSNWFINARVRLWKPMVEEMYLEEMKDHEMNNVSEDKSSKNNNEDPAMKTSSTTQDQKGPNSETEHKIFNNSKQDIVVSPIVSISTQLSQVGVNLRNNNNNNNNSSGFSFNIGSSSELDGITQSSPKKPRHNNNEIIMQNNNDSNSDQLSMKFDDDDDDDREGRDSNNNNNNNNGYSFIGNQTNFISGFGQYPIEEITRFDDVAEQFTTTTTTRFSSSGNSNSTNGVSLTLGLPHCDTISGTHQSFLQNQNIQLGMRLEMSETSEFGDSSAAFERINNMQNNPKRFVAQLLPDFVA